MRHAKLAALLVVMFGLIVGTAPAQSETLICTAITALPAVITVPGVYCLFVVLSTGMTSGNAIEIQRDNVVLDLNGYIIDGKAAGSGTSAIGIFASNRKNITIRNGTISGFAVGISLVDSGASQNHVVEDIRAKDNTVAGLQVEGDGIIVRNNQVVHNGGSTMFGSNASATGISVLGSGPRVLNNSVVQTLKLGTGIARAIHLRSVTEGLVVNNRIANATRGIEYDAGTGSTGKYRDNLTFTVTTPFTGGTDAGNNN
jgi:hypothetical protein